MMIAATLRQMAAPEATVKSEIHMGFSPLCSFSIRNPSTDSPSTPIPPGRSAKFCKLRGKITPK
jgi:hypothetical protein